MKILENIYDVFEAMEKRKAMFLGNGYTFQSLDNFVAGYQLAANEKQLEQLNVPNFSYFSTWLLGHLEKHHGLAGGWFWQISNSSLNDINAFEHFFHLLSIFKGSTINTRSIIVTSQAKKFSINGPVKRYDGDNLKDQLEPPFSIYWKSITNSKTVWIDFLDQNNKVFSENWYLNSTEANAAIEEEFGEYLNFG